MQADYWRKQSTLAAKLRRCVSCQVRSQVLDIQKPIPALENSAQKAAMSAYGTKQTSSSTLNMSAFGGKADITDRLL